VRRLRWSAPVLAIGLSAVALALAVAGPAVASCPNEAFRTGASARLPDCRAYEQVSPPDKNGSDALQNSAMASAQGDRLAWASQGSFAGSTSAQSVNSNAYLSTRGDGSWLTEGITERHGPLYAAAGVFAYTEDLGKAAVRQYVEADEPLAPEDPEGFNYYIRDNATRTYQFVATPLPAGEGQGFAGASADFGQMVFDSSAPLTPDSPCDYDRSCVYEWDRGALRLVSVLPDGKPTTGGTGATSWFFSNLDGVLSEDGRRVFFSASETAGSLFFRDLYVREDAARTLLISTSERTLAGGEEGTGARFLGAERERGDRVLFSTSDSLVDEDPDALADIYLYDFRRPVGERLTLLTEDRDPEPPDQAAALGVVARSRNLEWVLFAADNQITPDGPEAAGPKLYLWEDLPSGSTVTYLGPLSADDDRLWQPALKDNNQFGDKPARVSPNGRYIAFRASGGLTGFDNQGRAEIYLYDTAAHDLRCVSCVADAFPADGYIGFDATPDSLAPVLNHQLRNLADSGRLFFETVRGLLAGDSNGKIDVYEYEGGALRLISQGTSSSNARFLDADMSGGDVFFTTREPLVASDRGDDVDVYDARVGGGYPGPPPAPPACQEDDCQGPPAPAPAVATPESAMYRGPSNPKHRKKHPRRKHRKKHRHQKKHEKGQGRAAPKLEGAR
jgi:hypothetical protein